MEDTSNGVIIKLVAGDYTVLDNSGNNIICRGCGKFRNEDIKPLVGDRVIIDCISEDSSSGIIRHVLPRDNFLIRPSLANLNRLIITISAGNPQADLMMVDNLLILCSVNKITPYICINKIDTDIDNANFVSNQYSKSGADVILVSAAQNIDMYSLRKVVSDGITAFAGQSGVGKTTIIKKLVPDYQELAGELSRRTQRGKQTTRQCCLIPAENGGFIADTPGFSLLETDVFNPIELKDYYNEFKDYDGKCKFKGCNHINEPDCEVKKAVNNNLIDIERYNRYILLYKEFENNWRNRYD